MADQGNVGSGIESDFNIFAATVVVDDGSHVEIISEDESVVTQLIAEESGENASAQRSWHFRVKLGKIEVAGHDGIQLGHERGVGKEVFFEEICEGDVGSRKVMVRVAESEAVGGKVFPAGQDALLPHPTIEGAGFIDDVLGIAAPASTTEAVVLIRKVIEIEDWGKVEVDAEKFQKLPG